MSKRSDDFHRYSKGATKIKSNIRTNLTIVRLHSNFLVSLCLSISRKACKLTMSIFFNHLFFSLRTRVKQQRKPRHHTLTYIIERKGNSILENSSEMKNSFF